MHILAELTPLNKTSGARPLLRAASAQDRFLTRSGGQRWWPSMSRKPVISTQLFDGDFSSDVEVGSAAFTIRLSQLENLDGAARAYLWASAGITLYALPEGVEVSDITPYKLFNGKVSRFAADGDALSLTADVDTAPFEKNVLYLEYAGTTGIEGGADLKGRLKPWILGAAKNVEPVKINQVDNIYQFSAYGPIDAVTTLYERGASLGASVGDSATYAALLAATIPPGRWATCLASGLIRLGAPAYGVITGDVNGDKLGGTFARRSGAIITRVATGAGVSSGLLDATSLAALDTAVPRNINVVITDQMTVLEFARMLAKPSNAQAGVSLLGKLYVTRIGIGSPALTLDAQGRRLPGVVRASESEVSPPYKRIMMGANRSWRVHTFDEISSNVNLVDRGQYTSGETYREGNIVSLSDGSKWVFVGATPLAGSTPSDANANWERMSGAIIPVDTDGTALATLIADALAVADRKRTNFWQENAPTAAESEENDVWIKKSTGVVYVRVAGSGRLAIGSNAITLGGNHLILCWTEASDQRIGAALLAAAGAQATADGKVTSFSMESGSDPEPVGDGIGDFLFREYLNPVQVDRWNGTDWVSMATYGATAEQAATIDAIVNDNVLSRAEKPLFLLAYQALLDNHAALDAKAAALGIAGAERTAAAAEMATLATYLGTLSPSYSNTTVDTPIAGATFQDNYNDAASAVALLQAAIQGAPGDTGAPGNTVVAIYRRSATTPSTPTGNLTPSGWSTSKPAPDGTPLWRSDGEISGADGTTLVGVWSAPTIFEAQTVGQAQTTIQIDSQNDTFGPITRALEPSQTISVTARIRVLLSGSARTQSITTEYRLSGDVSWTTIDSDSDTDPFFIATGAVGTLTNSTGNSQVYEIRASTVMSSPDGSVDLSRSYLTA